jgi:putative membrane-bound dehydrogenase-like protein
MFGVAEQNRRDVRWALLAAVVLAASFTAGCTRGTAETVAPGTPTLHDTRLQITVFATEPDIVTPIGIAVDRQDRVFVLESHTHLQPRDYAGHSSDRVKIFTDATRDGKPDRVEVFADGIEDGMNIAFSPGGELYVVAAKTVWALHDRDGDGVSEARTAVLRMVRPERVYAHAALLGIAFSHDGWMYVSRGNTGGSPWRVEGTDGSFVSGYGDGGSIIRARPDGTEVDEYATGFWNPFDLTFDTAGRLLAADNDPDSRGPNRLVHVVEGGDYGYKSLYGGSGIHPYLSWNGELPGTLPYAVPLGEAPAGLLVAAHAALPADYREELLATIWEERRIVRIRLRPKRHIGHGRHDAPRGGRRRVPAGGVRRRQPRHHLHHRLGDPRVPEPQPRPDLASRHTARRGGAPAANHIRAGSRPRRRSAGGSLRGRPGRCRAPALGTHCR